VARTVLERLRLTFADVPPDRAGTRLMSLQCIEDLVVPTGVIGSVAAQALGPQARVVRAIFFDKSRTKNWGLAWHQDRTVNVEQKIEVPGFGPWTNKCGILHVSPPTDLLARMVTLRVHLDDVDDENAPLLIAPGSHLRGRVPEGELERVVAECGTYVCTAKAGDVWQYRTLIVHASERAREPKRRRVLQLDYAAEELPNGLRWKDLLGASSAPNPAPRSDRRPRCS
jgi:ectoine hydroxylase-related dioxygenase (phytanoyl-CoA dioxygenase family)